MSEWSEQGKEWAAMPVCPNCRNTGRWWNTVMDEYYRCPCGRPERPEAEVRDPAPVGEGRSEPAPASPKAAPSDLTQARAAAHVDGGWEALYGPDTRSAAYHEARARAERHGLEVAPEPESYRCGCADCPGLPWAPSRSTPHPCGRAAPAEPVVYELGGWYEPGYSPGDLTPEPPKAAPAEPAPTCQEPQSDWLRCGRPLPCPRHDPTCAVCREAIGDRPSTQGYADGLWRHDTCASEPPAAPPQPEPSAEHPSITNARYVYEGSRHAQEVLDYVHEHMEHEKRQAVAAPLQGGRDAVVVAVSQGRHELRVALEPDRLTEVHPSTLGRQVAAECLALRAAGEPVGVLLHGPPGTGKSVIARWVAREMGGFSLRARLGEASIATLRTLVDLLAPRVLLLDDIDRPMATKKTFLLTGSCPTLLLRHRIVCVYTDENELVVVNEHDHRVETTCPTPAIANQLRDEIQAWLESEGA